LKLLFLVQGPPFGAIPIAIELDFILRKELFVQLVISKKEMYCVRLVGKEVA